MQHECITKQNNEQEMSEKQYIFYYFIYIKVKNRQNSPTVVELTVVTFKEEGIGRESEGASVKLLMFYLFMWVVST